MSTKPMTLDELKTNIRQEITVISVETLVKTMEKDITFKKWCTRISLDHIKWLLKWTAKNVFFSHDWKKNILPTNMANPIFQD